MSPFLVAALVTLVTRGAEGFQNDIERIKLPFFTSVNLTGNRSEDDEEKSDEDYSMVHLKFYEKEEFLHTSWTRYFWLEISVRFFVGVTVGFNPAEFADFLLGWFGLDLAGDDREKEGAETGPGSP